MALFRPIPDNFLTLFAKIVGMARPRPPVGEPMTTCRNLPRQNMLKRRTGGGFRVFWRERSHGDSTTKSAIFLTLFCTLSLFRINLLVKYF